MAPTIAATTASAIAATMAPTRAAPIGTATMAPTRAAPTSPATPALLVHVWPLLYQHQRCKLAGDPPPQDLCCPL